MKREDIVAGLQQIEKDLLEQKEQTDDALGFVRECLKVGEQIGSKWPSHIVELDQQLKAAADEYAKVHPELVTWTRGAMDSPLTGSTMPPPKSVQQTWEEPVNENQFPVPEDSIISIPCAFCNQQFVPFKAGNIYCSKKCNAAAQRAKRKELKKAMKDSKGVVVTTLPEPKRKVDPAELAKKLADIASTCPKPAKRPNIQREL